MRRSRVALVAFLIGFAVAFGGVLYALLSAPTVAHVGSYVFETAYSDLAWPDALAFAVDGRMFYAERLSGSIRVARDGVVLPTPFYTFRDIDATGERGLLGLALAPGFPGTPWVYAYYTHHDTTNGTFENRIVRIHASGDLGTSVEVLFQGIPSATIHNGGVIAFGPDGKLWAVVGDHAVPDSAQDLAAPTGKVLRLNADGSVPPDNPFVGNASADPYVYTYGHRNMFGIAFHPATHAAYVTENGPSDNDEINLLVPGGDYGWPVVRGIARTPPYVDPILAYTPVIVPTNAVFYTGTRFAPLQGDLLFGDYANHRLHRLTLAGDRFDVVTDDAIVADAPDAIVGVAQSPDGQLWVTTSSAIYRLADRTAPGTLGIGAAARLRVAPIPTSPRNLSKGHDVPARDAGVPHPERGASPRGPRPRVLDPA